MTYKASLPESHQGYQPIIVATSIAVQISDVVMLDIQEHVGIVHMFLVETFSFFPTWQI